MNTEVKQAAASQIKKLIAELNTQIVNANTLGLNVHVQPLHRLSERNEQVSVEIVELVKF